MPSSKRPSLSSLPSHLAVPTGWPKWKALLSGSLNFYRIHLITFTIIPLITSAIMYACNTEYHISYVDCLFCCMSAMTVTGLATINLSSLSPFQQALLFIQMVFGSLTFVSIMMILVRQYFFRQSFKHVLHERERSPFRLSKTLSRVTTSGPPLTAAIKRKFGGFKRFDKGETDAKDGSPKQPSTPSSMEMNNVSHTPRTEDKRHEEHHKPKKRGHQKLRPDMIKRVQGGGVGLVNPMGWYDAERADIVTPAPTPEIKVSHSLPFDPLSVDNGRELSEALEAAVESGAAQAQEPRFEEQKDIDSDGENAQQSSSPVRPPAILTDTAEGPQGESQDTSHSASPPLSPKRKLPYAGLQLTDEAFPRSKTIAFEDTMDIRHDYRDRAASTQREGAMPRSATFRSNADNRLPYSATIQSGSGNFPRTYSLRPMNSIHKRDPRLQGFGGFPSPLDLGKRVFNKAFPGASKSLSKSFTVPRTNTFTGGRGSLGPNGPESKEAPYISFDATVGRNSHFRGLTTEQMDELGGVEYRALRVLLYTVIGYFIFMQLAAFIIFAPYIAAGDRYESLFQSQIRVVNIPWFSLFQSVSSFTNTGMSLCDTSMVPFQTAYLMIVVQIILIFAGNTAFPIFLRCTVWMLYKVVPDSSRVKESLKFLLDHPRRCFVYLFPATQTWVLALVMLGLTLVDWVSFLVLDLGTSVIAEIPVGTRIAAAFLQSAAVRAAGFSIVPLGELAPAVKVLYVIMMYVSVYPIALSVRATNVYEEKSLGLFGEDVDEDDFSEDDGRAQAVAKYIGWHARRQLAFDIWWLGFALWLVCIIERGHLDNDDEWFNIFNVLFELVSAYGTVGLSLGLQTDNFSFSGGFRKLSKLVLIAVMLRGRHRGLPVAIDRAVMLPKDFTAAEEANFEEERSRRASRRGSMYGDEEEYENRPNSFHGIPVPHEVNLTPGPITAIPIPHHHPAHPSNRSQHGRSDSFDRPITLTESPTMMPTSEDRWPQMGIRTTLGGLTPVQESGMSRVQTQTRDDSVSAIMV